MILEAYAIFTSGAFVANPAAFGPPIPISQSLVGGGGNIVSTNDIDLKATPFRDIGSGPRPLYVTCGVTTAFVGGGSVTVNLNMSANPGAGPYTLVEQIGIFPALAAVPTSPVGANTSVLWNQIQPLTISLRYISLTFVMNGGGLSAGAVYGLITPDPANLQNYPVGYTVATK